jgi:hypothetical protein
LRKITTTRRRRCSHNPLTKVQTLRERKGIQTWPLIRSAPFLSELSKLSPELGWHHHMALVMLSLSFLVKERILYKDACPLLSSRDIRLMIIAMLLNDPAVVDKRIAQMEIRHEQRRKDIERYYRAETVE